MPGASETVTSMFSLTARSASGASCQASSASAKESESQSVSATAVAAAPVSSPAVASVVSAADVAAITSPGVGVEPEVWDVTDAVGSRNAAAALAAVSRFELQNGFAVMMSGVLERFFRQLVDVAAGRTDGMNPYVVKKTAGFLRKWSQQEARVARWRFLTLREQAVSGATNNADVLLVATLVRVMRGGRGR